jgi:hypothetical protein
MGNEKMQDMISRVFAIFLLATGCTQRPKIHSRESTNAIRADLKNKDHKSLVVFLVAGAGLEPATFGL